MNDYEQLRSAGIVRRYEYDDDSVLVADMGFVDGSVDVIGETAIVVAGDEQYELTLPGSVSRATMNNGVVTIELQA
ncbi:MAG: DUF7127 family protein [Natronomonas sp.]